MSGIIVEELCRLCLNDCFPINNIFHDLSMKGSLLFEVVNYVYNLEISRDDGLPPNICRPCLWKLREFEVYKMNVHFAKKELVEIIGMKSVKQEIEENGMDIAGEENVSEEIIKTEEVQFFENMTEDDPMAIDVLDLPSVTDSLQEELDTPENHITEGGNDIHEIAELDINSDIDIKETEIPAEQVGIQKITEMEESTPLQHFHEMEIISAEQENSESEEDSLQEELDTPENHITEGGNDIHEIAELDINSDIDIKETEIPAEQVGIQKITEMEESTPLQHFHEMEIISAEQENSESEEDSLQEELDTPENHITEGGNDIHEIAELDINSDIDIKETEIPAEQVGIQKITEMEESTPLPYFHDMEIIPSEQENSESEEDSLQEELDTPDNHITEGGNDIHEKAELDINSETDIKETEIPAEQVEIQKITEMEESTPLQHFHEMEIISAEQENSESEEFFDVRRRMECHHCGEKRNTIQEIAQHIENTHNSIFNEDDTPIQQERKDKKHTCSMCERRFKEKPALTRHMLIHTGKMPLDCNVTNSCTKSRHSKVHMQKHTGDKPFQCDLCNYTCSQKVHLKVHMRKHTGEKPFQCNICDYSCSTKGNLKMHQQKHTGEKPFQCNICNYTCSQSGCMKLHMQNHTGEKPFQCDICNYTCSKKYYLKGHMRRHTGVKPFQCTICNYACSQGGSMKIHMRKHTGEKPFKCNICNYTFVRSWNLKIHMQNHTGEKPFQCNICNYAGSKSSYLKEHMRKHAGEKPFKCNICNYSSTTNGALKVHMRKHTGKPFQCSICNHRCSTNGQLKVHIRSHTGEKPFQCSICNNSYSTNVQLKVHMRFHTGEKPFQCKICNHSCTTSGELKDHKRIHYRKKPFQCNICNYSCDRSGYLEVHMRIHTGEKPFKCTICNYSSTTNGALKVHMRIHTGEKSFQCNICNFSSSSSEDLKVHTQNHT